MDQVVDYFYTRNPDSEKAHFVPAKLFAFQIGYPSDITAYKKDVRHMARLIEEESIPFFSFFIFMIELYGYSMIRFVGNY